MAPANNSTPRVTEAQPPKAPSLPAPKVPHVFVEKGLTAGNLETRSPQRGK